MIKDTCLVIVYVAAFATLFLPLLVADSMFFPYITGKNFGFRILVEVMLAGWVLLAFVDARYRPRFSWIAASVTTLVVVMFFANLFSEYAAKSFWSNFERMDGYVTLIHFYIFFLVLGSVFHGQKIWNYFLTSSVMVATIVALIGVSDYLSGSEASSRIDATLGNSTYMAIYMLFHIFIVGLLILRTKNRWLWAVGIATLLLFVYVLLQTGTRGTFIGLCGGGLASVVYMAIFARRYPELRKLAIGGLVAFAIVVGVFWTAKDMTVIQDNPALARYANLDLRDDLQVRMTIWNMAYEGFKERPILGWGQGSFNYVFNEKYDPALYEQEAWFDRVHNLVFDWLIAGGILGFLSYVSIFLALLFYLFWKPIFSREEQNEEIFFTVPERALLVGLFAGYILHNLVVFDNLISYIFFAVILAFIHGRVSSPIGWFEKFKPSRIVVSNIVAPVVVVVAIGVIYFVNVPGMLAARDIIDGLSNTTLSTRFDSIDRAYGRGSFADQEIVEQYSQQALIVAVNPNIPEEVKLQYTQRAEELIGEMITKKPGDARLNVFAANFYRGIQDFDKAAEQLEIAHSLSPDKQTIIIEQGLVAAGQENHELMSEYFKQAYELEKSFLRPRIFFAAGLLYLGEDEEAVKLVEEDIEAFAENDFALSAAYNNGYIDIATKLIRSRVDSDPSNLQNYMNLTSIYYGKQDIKSAVEVLRQAEAAIPDFKKAAECLIGNLEAGKDPNEGC